MPETQPGLTSTQAAAGLQRYGYNEIREKKKGWLSKLLRWLASPIAIMLFAAAFLSLFIDRIFDFYFILVLIVLNVGISLWHEHKADRAIEDLQKKLTVRVRVCRDGEWIRLESRMLVPEDVVECSVGDLIPADLEISEARNLSLNESVLTGESLPKEKKVGETAYSGSAVFAGWLRGTVRATGNHTYFGKIVIGTEKDYKRSALEKDILLITRFLMTASLLAVALLTLALYLHHASLLDIILLDLSLLIAGLPVSLPTVMTLIISLGASELAKRKAIVRRLSALEDLANVDLLLTDKTGTLTESKIRVEKILTYGAADGKMVLAYAASAASMNERSLIDRAVQEKAREERASLGADVDQYIPADSVRKRATVILKKDGESLTVAVGAPQVIATLAKLTAAAKKKIGSDVAELAQGGYRVIATAFAAGRVEKNMTLLGLLALSDTLRPEAAGVIRFLGENGVGIKMLTGDNRETGSRIAAALGIAGTPIARPDVDWKHLSFADVERASAFSEILPEDKYEVVKISKGARVVAVTGDGVNDLPAIKEADVGVAVENAVDALKSAADIVLTATGIRVIQDAFIEARKVFARLYSYSIYRLSESFRLIVTILILGFLYADYPLTPVQLILLALLNDIPIISLAFNRVKRARQPSKVRVKERFLLSTLLGLTGVANSLIMFFLLFNWLHLPWPVIQTAYFLKLTVSGHMLIYVAHTRERWYKYLPSRSVILATTITQGIATWLALSGLGSIVAPVSVALVVFVWIWSFFWMQIADAAKLIETNLTKPQTPSNPTLRTAPHHAGV